MFHAFRLSFRNDVWAGSVLFTVMSTIPNRNFGWKMGFCLCVKILISLWAC